jgi:uncharacterized protein YndB with AHSA1/START domain
MTSQHDLQPVDLTPQPHHRRMQTRIVQHPEIHARQRIDHLVKPALHGPIMHQGCHTNLRLRFSLVSETVTVSRDIDAPADVLWTMVSDVTRTGEWSPENLGGTWLGGATAAAPGAKFKAKNRNGSKSWSTVSTVLAAEPGRRFAFRVTAGPIKVADWSYTFEPAATGTTVTESVTDLRPGWFRPIAKLATGVADRATHNRSGMEQTLAALDAAATR